MIWFFIIAVITAITMFQILTILSKTRQYIVSALDDSDFEVSDLNFRIARNVTRENIVDISQEINDIVKKDVRIQPSYKSRIKDHFVIFRDISSQKIYLKGIIKDFYKL